MPFTTTRGLDTAVVQLFHDGPDTGLAGLADLADDRPQFKGLFPGLGSILTGQDLAVLT